MKPNTIASRLATLRLSFPLLRGHRVRLAAILACLIATQIGCLGHHDGRNGPQSPSEQRHKDGGDGSTCPDPTQKIRCHGNGTSLRGHAFDALTGAIPVASSR